MLSQKNVQMLNYLCGFAKEGQYARVEDLATKFHVSARTVRYDLDKIDYYLTTNGYPGLVRVKGAGVMLKVPEETVEHIRQMLCEIQVDTYVLSKQERALCIQMILFASQTPIKYEELAEELYVSRKTVIEDVRALREEGTPESAHIRAAKNGIFYGCEEVRLRRAILDRILDMFSPMELWELGSGIYLNRSIAVEKKWFDIMENADAAALEELLRRTEEEQKVVLSDDQFYLTILLTSLSHNRTAVNRPVTPEAELPEVAACTATAFFARLERTLGWAMPDLEQRYVLAEMARILNDPGRERAEKLAGIVTENLLVRVSDELSRKYFLDNVLRAGLQEHLAAVIKNGSRRRSEDEATIQAVIQENPRLFACIHRCLDQIQGLRLNGQEKVESALIALHFCAAEERRLMTDNSAFKALVVCVSGVGTAKIVSATVVKHFPQIRIVDTTSVHNVQTIIEQHRPDFILTTVPLNCRNTPVIQVNTLLAESDLDRIRSFIVANRKSGDDGDYRDIFSEIWNLVAETCEIRDQEGLERGLMHVLGIEKPRQPGLMELVQEDGILVGLEADDWEDAVRLSAQPLVGNGCLEPRYVQAMVDNIREMGPYIVIAPGIALPHSLPKDGVLRSCMGIAVLKHPVAFGNEANDPVRIVLCLGALDGQAHMRGMSALINLFSDEAMVERFCAARDREEILRILRAHGKD